MNGTLRIVLVLLLAAVRAEAQTPYTYTTNADGSLTITGYAGAGGAVSIPTSIAGASVSAIGTNAFAGSRLTRVTIPGSVNTLDWEAFLGCESLASVTILGNVTNFGAYVFQNCTLLTNLTLADGLTSIGAEAFVGCSNLPSVTIPGSITNFGAYAFQNCTGLTNATILDGATSIGTEAFLGCTHLASVTIPATITGFGTYAFQNCIGLINAVLADGLTGIGAEAFVGCSNLPSVTIPGSITNFGAYAFQNCTGLTNATLHDGLTTIGFEAFLGCTALASVTIPASITNFGAYAFQHCTSLTKVTILNGLTSMGSEAFAGCKSLASITIPASVTNSGSNTFQNCTSLTAVYFQGNAPSAESTEFAGDANVTVYYYAGASGWSNPFDGVPAVMLNAPVTTLIDFTSVNHPSGSGPAFLLAVDFNGDGHPGLVAANFGFRYGGTFGLGNGTNSTLSVFTNDGNGNLFPGPTLNVGLEPVGVAAADVNGDGFVDLICANVGSNSLTVLTNNGHGGFVLAGNYSVGSAPTFVAAADVNGDGKVDLISANFGSSSLTVLTNDGRGGFELSTNITVGGQPNAIAAEDFAGNGKVDLVCVNSTNGTLTTLTNDGKGLFTSNATITVPGGAGWVIGADVDGDGTMDLVTAGPYLTVFTNNGSGIFGLKSTAYSSGAGTVVAADMNGDGLVDLITPNNGNGIQGGATILTNDGFGNFTTMTSLSIGLPGYVNYPNTVTVADFNGDGNMDFAVDCFGTANLTQLTQTNVAPRPILAITKPAEDALIPATNSFTINATATSSNRIKAMLFYLDRTYLGTSTNSPFDWPIRAGSLTAGSHALQAAAVDSAGHIGWAPEIQVNVTSASTNAGPSSNGLLLWLDSSFANSVQTNAAGGLTAWLNKAPGATNALRYTGLNDNDTAAGYNSNAPTYVAGPTGAKVVKFNGNGYLDNLNFSSATPSNLTVFLLATASANAGNYSAFMAFNESPSDNDYQTGLNIDQGGNASTSFDRLNVEGAKAGGNGGFQFLNSPLNFGVFYLFEIDYGGGPTESNRLITVQVDDVFQSSIVATANAIDLNQCFIGTRSFASGGPSGSNHDLSGQIAAVLVYDHQLTGSDLTQTRDYLNGFFRLPAKAPVVSLSTPTNGASVLTSQSFVIKAASSTPVSAMDFFLDGQFLGETTLSPYTYQVPAGSISPGSHALQAVGVPSWGASGSSEVVYITVNAPGTTLIDFDPLNTSVGDVGGTVLADYLAQYGITIQSATPGTVLEAVNTNSLTGAIQVQAPSAPNFFTQAGLSQPVSFALSFATHAQAFGFTRAGLSATSGRVTHPAWTATIFDGNGTQLGSVSEALIDSYDAVPPRSFVLTGPNIASVRFDSDSQGIAAFSAVLLDNLILNDNPTAPQLSVALQLVSPASNEIVAPATLVLGANISDLVSSSYQVSYYAGPALLGTVSSSPYQLTVTNVLPGNYSLQAEVTDASGLAALSAVVPITVRLGPNSTLVDFDASSLPASKGPVTGSLLTSYLAEFGITSGGVTANTKLAVESQALIAGGGFVEAASPSNLLTQIGSGGQAQFTLNFAAPLSQFGWTRPELLAKPFVSHPAWQVTAFDGAGNVLGQAQEGEIDSATNVAAREFSLDAGGGAGIASVQFTSQGSGFTTFSAMLVDNLVLTTNTAVFLPAVAITSPASGMVLAAPPAVTIQAAASSAAGISRVRFYANGSLLGVSTSSPYSYQWQNPGVGNYELTAEAIDLSANATVSSPVSLVIQPSASQFGITAQPASQTVGVGGSATFSVVTTGTNAVTYQWYHNKASIPGAASSTLVVGPPIADADAGTYSVVAISGDATLDSEPALLTVVDPPGITSQPQGQSRAPGEQIYLSVTAAGAGPFTYQWLLNGVSIPGATNSVFTVTSAQPLNSGNYQAVVGNLAANVLSAVAPVVVETAVTIPPTNNTFASSAPLNPLLGPVAASNQLAVAQPGAPLPDNLAGGNSIWFNWKSPFTGTISLTTKGSDFDTVMAVYTGAALNKLKAVAADDDSGGYLTSLVTFNVTAGTNYQIAVDGYEGASGRVVLGMPSGTGYRILNPSSGASVPVIVKGPSGVAVAPGAKVTLSVQAASPSKLAYQWYFMGAPIPGATRSSLVVGPMRPGLVGYYFVLVENSAGSAQSEPASVQMTVVQGVTPATTENKFVNNSASQTPASLAVNITPQDNGGDTRGFSVAQVFSTVGAVSEPGEPEPCGQVGTASQWFVYAAQRAGTLHVSTDGSTFNTLLGIYTNTGSGSSFSNLTEVGCGYATNYAAEGQPSVAIPDVAEGTKFYILVAGYQGAMGVAQLQVGLGKTLSFAKLPASQRVAAGNNVTLSAATAGSIPSSYQWQLNGANVAGGTKSSYTVTNAQAGAQGNYTVIVRNVVGAVTSSPPAALTVLYAPVILSGPSNEIVTLGHPAKFTVTAVGGNEKTNKLAAQWLFDGAPIPKAASLTLTIPTTSLTNSGSYSIIVSNGYGAVTSGPATLTVVAKAVIAAGNTGGLDARSLQVSLPTSATPTTQSLTQAATGTYGGLFSPATGANAANSGWFTATLAAGGAGAFSASILLDGNAYPFTGQFDAVGNAWSAVPRPGKTPLGTSLRLAAAPPGLTGVISNADWLAPLQAGLVLFTAATNPAPDLAGDFALVVPPGVGAPLAELLVTNLPGGAVSVTGSFTNGAAFVRAAPIVTGDAIPLYAPLDSGSGLFFGWLRPVYSPGQTNFGQGFLIGPPPVNTTPVLIFKSQ